MKNPNTTSTPDTAADPATGSDSAMQGEGNYDAAHRYRRGVGQFIEEGKVEEAADNAAPTSPGEAQELDRAERAGRGHAQGEDEEFVKKEVERMKR